MSADARPETEQRLLLDVNNASEDELEQLPGIGPAYSSAIVRARIEDGPYRSPRDLLERGVIPERVFRRISQHVSATPPAAPAAGRNGTGPAQRTSAPALPAMRAPRALPSLAGLQTWARSPRGRRGLAIGAAAVALIAVSALFLSFNGGTDSAHSDGGDVSVSATSTTDRDPSTATPESSPASLVTTVPTAVPVPDSPVRFIGGTGGDGVALRDECEDGARLDGAWPEGTEVVLLQRGTGSCFTWSYVRSGDQASWVKNAYLIEQENAVAIVTGTSASVPNPGTSWAQQFCIQYRVGRSYYQVCRTFPTLERSQWTSHDLATYGHISIQRLNYFADCYINRAVVGRPLDRCAFARL